MLFPFYIYNLNFVFSNFHYLHLLNMRFLDKYLNIFK